MTFAEQLKNSRRQAGLSQEQLAEQLGVSRQAITKWETGAGMPEAENLLRLASLFGLSLDTFFSQSAGKQAARAFLYESVTEYDIDESKHYDMKLGAAARLILSGSEGEKLRVRLLSNTMPSLQKDFKVKIEDIRQRIDVQILRKNGVSETAAREALTIQVEVPCPYLLQLEAAIHAEEIELRALPCPHTELEARCRRLLLEGVEGTVEVDCNEDMEINCRELKGRLEINQLSAVSRLLLPRGLCFTAGCGRSSTLLYARAGKPAEDFSAPEAALHIQLNGSRNELTIEEQAPQA